MLYEIVQFVWDVLLDWFQESVMIAWLIIDCITCV